MPYILYEKRGERTLAVQHRLTEILHLHKAVEVVYVAQGEAAFLTGGETFPLAQGEVSVAFPMCPHAYGGRDPLIAYLLVLELDEVPLLAPVLKGNRPLRPVVRDPDGRIGDLFRRALAAQEADGLYREEIVRGYLQVLLAEILQQMQLEDRPDHDLTTMEKLLLYCNDHYTEPLSLDRLARALGVSRYYISRVFSAKVHMSFPEYINALRVAAAKRLLRETEQSVAAVAEAAGFSGPRVFGRCFEAQTGLSPRAYRKKKKQNG